MEVPFLHFSLDSESKGSVDFYPGLVQPSSQVQSSQAYSSPWAQPVPRVPGHPSLLRDELDPSLGMDLCISNSARKRARHLFTLSVTSVYKGGGQPGVPSSSTGTHTFGSGEKAGQPTAGRQKER